MKFISKSANYRIVLRPGIPGSSVQGTQSIPGLYVKFEDSVANVTNEEQIKLLMASEKFNIDFVVADDIAEAARAYKASSVEPEHDMINIEYGHVGKNSNPKGPVQIGPDMQKAIAEMASKMAMDMAGKMAVEMAAKLVKEMSKDSKDSKEKDTKKELAKESVFNDNNNKGKGNKKEKENDVKETENVDEEEVVVTDTELK